MPHANILTLRALIRWVRRRLHNRPDTEHEMVLNRLVIGPLIVAYLCVLALLDRPGLQPMHFYVILAYVAASVALAVDLILRPGVSNARRFLAMAVDLGTLSYGLHVGGGLTALLYPIYLWVIFGNGFRFGLRYLLAAAALSVDRLRRGHSSDGVLARQSFPGRRPPARPDHPARLCLHADPQALGGQGPGRGGKPGEEPVPRERQPRAAHAAQRRDRNERSSPRFRARRGAGRHGEHGLGVRPLAAVPDRRHPRFLAHRGRAHAGTGGGFRSLRDAEQGQGHARACGSQEGPEAWRCMSRRARRSVSTATRSISSRC